MFFNSSVLVWITCPLLYGWLMYGNVTGSGSNYFAVIQTRSQVMYSKFCLSTGEWTVVQEELSAWTRHATFSSCSSLCRPKPSVLCETFPQPAWLRKPIIWGWFIPMISLLNMAFPLRAYDYGRVRFLLLQILFCLQICNWTFWSCKGPFCPFSLCNCWTIWQIMYMWLQAGVWYWKMTVT